MAGSLDTGNTTFSSGPRAREVSPPQLFDAPFETCRASLSREQNIKIVVAGVIYFIAGAIDEMVMHYGHLNEVR